MPFVTTFFRLIKTEASINEFKYVFDQYNPLLSYQDSKGNTALHIASDADRGDVVNLLIEKGVGVNQLNYDGATPLWLAASKGKVDIINTLISAGATIDLAIPNGSTPLFVAAIHGHVDAVNALIIAGANRNHRSNDGTTALLYAANNGHLDTVSALLNRGADSSLARSSDNCTPLLIAAYKKHDDIFKVLLEDQQVTSPMLVSVIFNEAILPKFVFSAINRLEKFIQLKGDLGLKDAIKDLSIFHKSLDRRLTHSSIICEFTLLDHAAIYGLVNVINALVEAGATVDLPRDMGATPLIVAAERDHVDALNALILAGANPNYRCNNGTTALFFAAMKGGLDTVNALLSQGANCRLARASDDCTPLQIAGRNNREDCFKALLEHPDTTHTMIIKVLSDNEIPQQLRLCAVKLFLQDPNLQSNVNLVMSNGLTPLFIAAQYGHLEAVNELLKNGADISLSNKPENITPLHIAARNGHKACFDVLLKQPKVTAVMLVNILLDQNIPDDFNIVVSEVFEKRLKFASEDTLIWWPKCSITGSFILEPVMSPYGHCFEKAAIYQSIDKAGETCPITRRPLTKANLVKSFQYAESISNILVKLDEEAPIPLQREEIAKHREQFFSRKHKQKDNADEADNLYVNQNKRPAY